VGAVVVAGRRRRPLFSDVPATPARLQHQRRQLAAVVEDLPSPRRHALAIELAAARVLRVVAHTKFRRLQDRFRL